MSGKHVFISPLGDLLEKYIEHKRMRGYKSASGEHDVRLFDAYAASSPIAANRLTKELVEAYIAGRPGEKQTTQSHRISTVRCFGKYLVRCGIDAYVLPYGTLSVAKYGFVPYVFNAKEIAGPMGAADLLPRCANSPFRHMVIPMMFRLIYGCGLRISEAIGLTAEDVDLKSGVVLVRAAKFNKNRYVPMSGSLLAGCGDYVARMGVRICAESPFFPSPTGSFYGRSSIEHAFLQCLAIAGIPHFDDGPTVHSLRHSFAVQNLVKWDEEGKDVNAMLPYLSAYMGHENLLGTERYLRMTMEMFPALKTRIGSECSWIMPEVVRDEH
jgi:integrase